MNPTHQSDLLSWVDSANAGDTDFPIQNLPLGIFRKRHSSEPGRVGVAIGNQILDIGASFKGGLFSGPAEQSARACTGTTLNPLMALGRHHSSALRARLSEILRAGSPDKSAAEAFLTPMNEAEMLPPAQIGDFTDFYASIHHATNVGSMFRPDNPLLPNYKYVPIAYHGRSSSVVVSGTSVTRPTGQTKNDNAPEPEFGPTRALDYELEVGLFVGSGNSPGKPVDIARAEDHMFGLCLVNDWSARDIQRWEYQPLGPFLAKNFSTTISPWIVTMDALEPFRVPSFQKPQQDPQPLPYLDAQTDRANGGIDLTLEVYISTQRMRHDGLQAVRMSRGNFRDMYWTFAQMLTHHTSNGCNLRPGDLLGSGTVSGSTPDSRGCLLELTAKELLRLPGGDTRRFLQDGDEVIFRAYCERTGARRIGFGECRGTISSNIPGNETT